MDEIWRRLAWILGTGGFGAVFGAVFGGVTGAIHWSSGRAAGTFFAHRIVDAFEKAGEQEMSRRMRGTFVGATDGFLFLGVVGTLAGVIFAYVGRPDQDALLFGVIGIILHALAAMLFGVLAYAIVRNGAWGVVGLFFGTLLGGFSAALLLGRDRLLFGVVPGMIVGTAASFLVRRYVPQFQRPNMAKGLHEQWRQESEPEA